MKWELESEVGRWDIRTKLYWFFVLTVHRYKAENPNHLSCVYFDLINAVLTRCTQKNWYSCIALNDSVNLHALIIFTRTCKLRDSTYGNRGELARVGVEALPLPLPLSTLHPYLSIFASRRHLFVFSQKKVTSELRCLTTAVWQPWCDICTSTPVPLAYFKKAYAWILKDGKCNSGRFDIHRLIW